MWSSTCGDRTTLFSEIARVLRPAGRAFVTVINRLALVDPHYHLRFVNWLPRNIGERYIAWRRRTKDSPLRDRQKLGDMHYFTFGGAARLAASFGTACPGSEFPAQSFHPSAAPSRHSTVSHLAHIWHGNLPSRPDQGRMTTSRALPPKASIAAIFPRIAVRRDVIGVALVAAAALGFFAVYYVILKGGHPTLWPGSYEYAQSARNIEEGQGLNTNAATVLEFWFLGSAGMPLPYFFHDVGNSLLLALFFKLFGASDTVIGWMSGTFFILTAPLTFLLRTRLFNRRVALIAAALVLVNTELIVFSVTGHSEVPYALLLTLFLYLLYTERSGLGLVLAGFVFGFLIVLRSNSLPFLPLILLFIAANPTEALRRWGPCHS